MVRSSWFDGLAMKSDIERSGMPAQDAAARTREIAMHKTKVRDGMPSVQLTRREFEKRFRAKFYDPLFDALAPQLDKIVDAAWTAYDDYHKSPRVRPAGKGYADPTYELSDEWRATSAAVKAAEKQHRRRGGKARILLINGSSRTNQSCPGEMSKTYRLCMMARDIFDKSRGIEVDFLDMSLVASEYGKHIHPCKACVSTAMPLCHWPCSCYPNHALGQTNDWMAELYPRWVAAHGVMIVTPVNWYQAPTALKAMIDRLVCADGGNPDPTTTHGKDPDRAKAMEMKGWSYPRHLAGRVFGVVAHGDDYSHTERTQTLMEIFEREGVSMVSSNCQVMNRRGERLGHIAQAESHRITLESIVRNGWQPTMLGATHAIHRDVLQRFGGVDPAWLPVSYDMAFPFRGTLLKGSYYTDAELVAWRRHGGNMTDRLIRAAHSPAEQAEGLGGAYMTELMGMFNDLRTLQRAYPNRGDLDRVRGQLMRTAMVVLDEWIGVRNKLISRGVYPTWTPLSELPEADDDHDGKNLNWLFRRLLRPDGSVPE